MISSLLSLLLTQHLLLPLQLMGFSLPLGLLLLSLGGEAYPLRRAAGWQPPLWLVEAFGRWLGLLQLLPLLLSLALLTLRGFGEAWPLGGLRLGASGEAFGLSLNFSDLGFFFALMAQLVLVLTDLNFRCSPLEERSREQGPAFGDDRRRHRARRNLLFGLCLGLLQLLLLLFFYTDNLLVFFGAFESSVLPIFLLMGYFGKRSQKFRAMAYLLFFTLLSAVPLLLLLLELYRRSGTVDYGQLLFLQRSGLLLTETELPWAFMAFFLPFGVKMAAFPLHGWLPEAHVEASTEGSMLLSGVLLKVGLYGLLRCCLELCGGATLGLAPYLLTVALVGALLTSLSAYRQLDLKKIIAYSSVVHMNLSLVGCFCLSSTALSATLFLNFGHAVVSAGLFAAVGVLQDRTRTRNLLELSGLDRVMPLWSGALLLLLLANAGMPGTVGFVGEAGLLWGCFQHFMLVGFLALPTVGIMGLRNLLLYTQLCWGVAPAFLNPLRLPKAGAPETETPEALLLLRHWDVTPGRDGLVLLLLATLSLLLGFWPQPLLELLEESSLLLSDATALESPTGCFYLFRVRTFPQPPPPLFPTLSPLFTLPFTLFPQLRWGFGHKSTQEKS